MVTKQDVREVRKFLDKFKSKTNVSMSDDVLNAIEEMCAVYELKYNM